MDRLCRACFDGTYPVELPEGELLGKHLLEGIESLEKGLRDADNPMPTLDIDGLPTLMGGGGAAAALTRP
jgi:amidophosphoribosyltransferase